LKIPVADIRLLISLIVIDKLSVLLSFYKEIFIPEAVWKELNNHVEINTVLH
jgi:predicted nucleic acid-binding protein